MVISQSKRAFGTVPQSFIDEAYAKHEKILTTAPEPMDEELGMEKTIRVVLRSFLRNWNPENLVDEFQKKHGSTSASNAYRRHQGGGRAEIQDLISAKFNLSPDSFIAFHDTIDGLVEERGLPPLTREQWIEFVSMEPDSTRADGDMETARVVAICESLKVRIITAMDGQTTFAVKPIQKSLWDYMSKFPMFDLLSQPSSPEIVSRLLRRTQEIFPDIALDTDVSTSPSDDDQPEFVSGDYQSATDLLKPRATEIAEEEISRKLKGDDVCLRPALKRTLGMQQLEYPKTSLFCEHTATQLNGQLMGCVMSFLVLCLLNLNTYFKSLPLSVQKLFLNGKLAWRLLPVLINGDDILFRAKRLQRQKWVAAANDIGFQLSVGKNFIHPRFFIINSLAYVFNPFPKVPEYISTYLRDQEMLAPGATCTLSPNMSWADDVEIWESSIQRDTLSHLNQMEKYTLQMKNWWLSSHITALPYANLGLLLGKTKTGEQTSEKVVSLKTLYDASTCGGNGPFFHSFFLHFHSQAIRTQTKFGGMTLNIFAHPRLGGLGFNVPKGVEPEFNVAQRILATRLFKASTKNFVGQSSDDPSENFQYLESNAKVSALG
uniref:RNA-dependent RNA polymerase n=1 Tax=Hubei narna-like virus 10 TaxID=1922940 RepID=A0A1L3KIG8_9VIRU|nr:hypothetical protein [Hubei narna-like virus 10]